MYLYSLLIVAFLATAVASAEKLPSRGMLSPGTLIENQVLQNFYCQRSVAMPSTRLIMGAVVVYGSGFEESASRGGAIVEKIDAIVHRVGAVLQRSEPIRGYVSRWTSNKEQPEGPVLVVIPLSIRLSKEASRIDPLLDELRGAGLVRFGAIASINDLQNYSSSAQQVVFNEIEFSATEIKSVMRLCIADLLMNSCRQTGASSVVKSDVGPSTASESQLQTQDRNVATCSEPARTIETIISRIKSATVNLSTQNQLNFSSAGRGTAGFDLSATAKPSSMKIYSGSDNPDVMVSVSQIASTQE